MGEEKRGKVGVKDEIDWVAQHLLWIQDVFGKHKKYLARPVRWKTAAKVNPVYCSLWVTDEQMKADVSSNMYNGTALNWGVQLFLWFSGPLAVVHNWQCIQVCSQTMKEGSFQTQGAFYLTLGLVHFPVFTLLC